MTTNVATVKNTKTIYNKMGLIFLAIVISIICFITPLGVLVGIHLFSLEYKEKKKDKAKATENNDDEDSKYYKKFCLIFFSIVVLLVLFFTPLGAILLMILITLGYSILYAIPDAWLIIPLILITYKSIKYLIRLYKTNIEVEKLPYQDKPKVTQIYKHLNENKKVVIVTIFLTFICLTPTIYNDLSFRTWGNTLTLYRNIFEKTVVIPKRVEIIGDSAFECYTLKINEIYSVDMTNVEKISKNAFYNQERLTQVNFSDNLEIIGENAFSFCGLEEINLPDLLKIIEDRAFYGNVLKNVIIPNGVTYIGKGAFGGWDVNIKTITIPDSVEYISDDLFTTLHDYDNRVKTTNEMFIPEESPLVLVKPNSYAESVCIKNAWNFDYY